MTAAEDAPSTALAAALEAAARGWRPFPLDHPALPECANAHKKTDGVCPAPDKRGKHPVGHWPTMTATTQHERMLRLWFGGELRNIGIGCKASKLLVLDEDELGALEALAKQLGEEVPRTYRVRTYQGQHYYFSDPDGEFGNEAGALYDHHIDVRGSRGKNQDGGYVVGAGSVHMSGTLYEAVDPQAPVAPIPEWVKEQIRTPATSRKEESSAPAPEGGWTDEPVEHDAGWMQAQYQRHLDRVGGRGNVFRHSLYLAALDGWRLVDTRLTDHVTMLNEIKDRIVATWGADPDERDRHIVYVEARDAATKSPWVLRDSGSSKLKAGGNSADAFFADAGSMQAEVVDETAVAPRSGYEIDLDHAVRQERLRREARRILAIEERPPIEVLDFDAFLDAPQVDYLVPRMLWRTGVSRVFGPPGETKSFLLLDLALSLATGTPWRGHALKQVTVHYVMAEGQAVNTTRALAWMHHHGVPRSAAAGRFKAIPQGVLLTPEGIAEYVELVRQDQPGLIILDTKARMMVGEENSASDSMVMMRAVDALKEVSTGNVCLVDHTGLNDASRARGSNSVLGATDTEVKVTLDRDTGLATAEVTRDKAAEPGAEWLYRLHRVDGTPGLRPGTPTPAVVVPIEDDGMDSNPLGLRSFEWWQDHEPVPEVVAALSGPGADAARDIYRVLRYVQEHEGGVTMAFLRTAVGQRPSAKPLSEATARRGRTRLEEIGVVITITGSRYALAPAFWDGKGTPS